MLNIPVQIGGEGLHDVAGEVEAKQLQELS